MTTTKRSPATRQLLNKVPEITIYFWIIKVLCTTVGETAADFLNVNLNFGLTGTSIATGVVLAIALVFQFRAPKYIPSVYWLTVTLVSVFGTLVTDNLTDNLGLPLEASTLIFAALLAVTFLVWYRTEHTLSIHSIVTRRREAFYWLAILFTFALGTASGDLMAERLGLGYLVTGIIVAALIAITAVGWKLGLNSVLSFWIIYILTRPLGASIGDYLSQPASHGGLGLGTTVTSMIFVGGIIGIVVYLSVTKADVITGQPANGNSTRSDDRARRTRRCVAHRCCGVSCPASRGNGVLPADVRARRGIHRHHRGAGGHCRWPIDGGFTPGRPVDIPNDHPGFAGSADRR